MQSQYNQTLPQQTFVPIPMTEVPLVPQNEGPTAPIKILDDDEEEEGEIRETNDQVNNQGMINQTSNLVPSSNTTAAAPNTTQLSGARID